MRRRFFNQPLLIGGREVQAFSTGAVLTRNGRWLILYTDPILDAEAFCNGLLKEAFDEWGHYERPDEYDEALQELLIRALRLERTYDPERSQSFADYARYILRRRAADVGPRRLLGRSGNRIHDYLHDTLEPGAGTSEPGEPLGTRSSDPNRDWGDDAVWLPPERNRERARRHAVLGLPAARRAA
jgi:DNA-directed RNA polymerase specialized sigma24 family protein